MMRVVMPELGEGIEKATISYWYVEEGQEVKKGDDLVEVTTEKATFNIPCPCEGTIAEIFYHDGESAEVGEVVATIEEFSDEDQDPEGLVDEEI
jgi:pyruvate/2-oxoglutarate dehydrogenase complex dihydrolipoamide acyltransferase (E2) component